MTTAQGVPLVTGASGFAGSHLLEHLLLSHDRVAGWANSRPAKRSTPLPACSGSTSISSTGRRCDVRSVSSSRRSSSIAPGCHMSPNHGRTPGGRCRSTRSAPTTCSTRVREFSPHARVIVAGSALVYRQSDEALSEESPVGPNDPYGLSKLAQEMVALRAETPVVATRPFNHIGPRQQPSFATSSFARQIAEIEAGRREPVMLVGNLDSRRDLTDVRDTVRAYDALASRGTPDASTTSAAAPRIASVTCWTGWSRWRACR